MFWTGLKWAMAEVRTHPNYNYTRFVLEEIRPIMGWEHTPQIGKSGPDFSLWNSETKEEVSLRALIRENQLTVVEFGSFT